MVRRAESGRTSLRVVIGCLAGISVTLALPVAGSGPVGGRAWLVGLPPEPRDRAGGVGEVHGRYLLLTETFRPRSLAEMLWQRVHDLAATAQSGSMAESKAMAWASVIAVVGPVLHVQTVAADTPAERAGVRSGDQIVAVNGQPATTYAIDEALATGHDAVLRMVRAGSVLDADLQPLPPWPQPRLGGLDTAAAPLDGPPPAVETGHAIGSSAGLVLALAELDLVTPGDLTGGKVIAATGELGPGGYVAPVQGYDAKVAAALRTGATILVVPTQARDHVRAVVPPGVTVIGTGSVTDAMWQLCSLGGTASTCGNARFDTVSP